MRNQIQEKPILGISWGSSKTWNSCAVPHSQPETEQSLAVNS